jgi:hypothetical protein
MSLHFSRKSRSLVEHLGKAALFGGLSISADCALSRLRASGGFRARAIALLFECRLRTQRVSPSHGRASGSNTSLTGPTLATRPRSSAVRQPRHAGCRSHCRGRVRTFADLRRVVRRGDPRPHASAIPAGAHVALAPLETPTHRVFGAATLASWTALPQPRWRTSALRCPQPRLPLEAPSSVQGRGLILAARHGSNCVFLPNIDLSRTAAGPAACHSPVIRHC